jgi:iron complex outermembrane recepter protein
MLSNFLIGRAAVTRGFILGGASIAAFFSAQSALAQTAPASDTELTQIVVTGSRIARTDTETPSPVQIITAEDLKESGFTNTAAVLQNLTANGQGTLSQSFSGAFASGAAGVALRGLNVGYTLTLIDGHRMAPYPIGDDGQRSFVDVANIPFDSIDTIEILKDGASAIYGSDAIAGVVNIKLKKTYVGAQITADAGTSSRADGNQGHVAFTFGMGDLDSDGHNFFVSGEFRKQQQILFDQRGGIFENLDYTASGGINATRGVPTATNGGLPNSATGYVLNPTTGAIAGFGLGCTSAQFNAGGCAYHDTWDQIQPNTTNWNFVGKFTQNLAHDWQLGIQGTYFESLAQQVDSPSSAFTGGYQGVSSGPGQAPGVLAPLGPTTISSTNPSYPAAAAAGGLDTGLLVNQFFNLGYRTTDTDSKSYRAIADLDGKIGSWNINVSGGYTEVVLDINGYGYVNPANLQTALDSTTDPFLIGQQNSAALNNFVAPELTTTDKSWLNFAHLEGSTTVMELPGGPWGLDIGADFVYRRQDTVAPPPVAAGTTPNFSNNFTVGSQEVASVYMESNLLLLKGLEVDPAVRYDHYNLSGGQASPKIGVKYTPVQQLAIRATAAKGFRAPGPAENGQAGQTFFAGTTNDPVLCPNPGTPTAPGNFVGQCVLNIPGLQGSNRNLEPETSKTFTLGLIYEPFHDLSSTLDLYTIQINNQIVTGGNDAEFVRGTNETPILQYQPGGGTALVAPPAPPILYYGVTFINANKTFTDGFDYSVDYHHSFDGGWKVQSKVDWAYIHEYEMTIGGVNYQVAGTHGPSFFSGDTGNPKSRVQWSNTVAQGPWSLTATMNYISSFSVMDPTLEAFEGVPAFTCHDSLQNQGGTAGNVYQNILAAGNIPAGASCNVNHFTTWDLYGKWDVTDHFNLHGSVLNLFKAQAPLDWVTYGGALGGVPWNPSMHYQGAVGQYFNLGFTYKFQ